MTTADELLLCDESVAIATPRKETVRVAKPLPKPSPPVAAVAAAAREDETWFDVCPWEAIEMRLKRETSGDYTRDANYLVAVQTHGMDAMWRTKMCRWMFETAQAFKLTPDSVGCAIHFMDQYLSEHSVDKVLLQLLCLVCMYIAAKMHEAEPITMKEMELLCENKFTPEQILSVEAKVLEVLDWKLNAPVAFTFARDFLALIDQHECDPADLEAHVMAVVQVATEDFGSVQFPPSAVGISAVKVIARAHSLPVLEAAATKAIAQLQLPRREFANCYAYVCRIYIAHFPSELVFADLADAPTKTFIDTTPTASDPHPRIDSPTSHATSACSLKKSTASASSTNAPKIPCWNATVSSAFGCMWWPAWNCSGTSTPLSTSSWILVDAHSVHWR